MDSSQARNCSGLGCRTKFSSEERIFPAGVPIKVGKSDSQPAVRLEFSVTGNPRSSALLHVPACSHRIIPTPTREGIQLIRTRLEGREDLAFSGMDIISSYSLLETPGGFLN